jgi:hypothetical protein
MIPIPAQVSEALLELFDVLGDTHDTDLLTDCLLHFNFDVQKVSNWVMDHPGILP